MKLTARDDWAVSEVIGAVLLVGLVVVGGSVAGVVYFSQAQPKGIPHLSFNADHNNKTANLTLYHTGGDTLAWNEFRVYVDGNDSMTDIKPGHQNRSWSFNQPLTIERVYNTPGTVVLTYVGTGSGETILRKVVFTEDGKPGPTSSGEPATTATTVPTTQPTIGPWTISGHKWSWSDGQRGEGLGDVLITLRVTQGNPGTPVEQTVKTGLDGFYIFQVPEHEATYEVFETVPDGWHAVNSGTNHTGIRMNNGHSDAVTDQDFENERDSTPTPTFAGTLSGYAFITPGDAGAAGAVVQLSHASNSTLIDQATINQSGAYLFASLPAGDYAVSQIPPGGYSQLMPPDNGVYTRTIDQSNPSFPNLNFTDQELPRAITGTLSGYLWMDSNADGLFTSPGEVTLNAFIVNLTCPNGTVLQTTTSGYGNYSFANLPAGTYTVSPKTRADFFQVHPADGAGYTRIIETDGQTFTDLDFGLQPVPTPTPTIPPGSGYISGFKWNDLNGDHKWDSGETPLANWTIVAEQQGDGSIWTEMGRRTTDANGFYNISGLSEGHYRVHEVQQEGWEQTYPTDSSGFHNFNLNDGHPFMDHQDFGNHQVVTPTPTILPTPTATSGVAFGMVYHDRDDDHHLDEATEEGLEGWTVYLERKAPGDDWEFIASTVTDAEGNYYFYNVPDGHYRSYEVVKSGWERTWPTDAGGFNNFQLQNGGMKMTGGDKKPLFGNHLLSNMLTGRKYSDQNANHQFDTGETPLSGWTINLYQQNTEPPQLVTSTTTGTDGTYQFTGVANGAYRVAEAQRAGWNQTAPSENMGTHLVTVSSTQVYWPDLDFGNHDGPIAGYGNYMVLNNPHNSAVMRDGYYIQFRNHGLWDFVDIGGQHIVVPEHSTVRLEINGDQTLGEIYMIHQQVSTFSFNARLYVNEQLRGNGQISSIWFAGTNQGAGVDQFVTNIHYLMPKEETGFQFTVDGKNIVTPPWWPYTNWGVYIYNFGPASHPGGWEDTVLNLKFEPNRTYLVCSGWYEVIK